MRLVASSDCWWGWALTRSSLRRAFIFQQRSECLCNCHIMREHLASWQKSSHHTRAVCNDCHMPHQVLPKLLTKADNGWNHSVKFTLQNYGDPIRIRPANGGKDARKLYSLSPGSGK